MSPATTPEALVIVPTPLVIAVLFFLLAQSAALLRLRAARNELAQVAADVVVAQTGVDLRLRLRELRFVVGRLSAFWMPRWLLLMVQAVKGQGADERTFERIPDQLPVTRPPSSARGEVRPPSLANGAAR